MPYVYSTLSSDHDYAIYDEDRDPAKVAIIKPIKTFHIKGKANVMDKKAFVTPKGVVTSISTEDLKILETNKAFQRHKDRGFITVESKSEHADKVARNTTPKDNSAQLVASDFENKPILNKAS